MKSVAHAQVSAAISVLLVVACGSGGGDAAGSNDHASSGGSTSSVPGSGGASQAESCDSEPVHTGQATYYSTADGSGNCSFDPTPDDLMVGAMNAVDYADSAVCGGCAHIVGPSGDITIRIVDQCPECPQGNIDLSPEAFDGIAQRSLGRVAIQWTYVACAVTGDVSYRFKEGSSQYWTAVQVRNHRYRVAKFEYEKSGAFVNVTRQDYNYFVEPNGMGPGPYAFRVTDVYGAVVTDTGIPLEVAQVVPGSSQFPVCSR